MLAEGTRLVGLFILFLVMLNFGMVSYILKLRNQLKSRKVASEANQKSLIQDEKLKLARDLEDLYNKSPSGYHSLDKNGVFQVINDTELRWLQYTREEVVGKINICDLLTPNGVKVFQNNFPKLQAQGYIENLEVDIIRKDGKVFAGLINATAVYDETGHFILSRSTMLDITKWKQIEGAKADAQQSSRAKTEFLSHMSHEIRTPLNIINGMGQILQESPLNEEQKKYVNMLEKASNTLLNIINDILDISKIESGFMNIEKSAIHLKNQVKDIIDLWLPIAVAKNLSLNFSIDSKLPEFILGDELRIRQILANLISNAIKFTEKGSIEVRIQGNLNPKIKGNILFSVTDSGIGISTEQEQFLFKPFSQANSTITKNYGGTGLGLAICKKLVELMDGEIWVESQFGIGSTFYFSLAVEQLSAKKSETPKTTDASLQQGEHNIFPQVAKSGNILLVDDSQENRNLIKFFLKNTNYNITEAENGAVAVAKAKIENFDLILMDMQMPILDGYSATSQIRNWEQKTKHPHTPIVALTAYALAEERQKSIAAGCDKHMAKPIKKVDLVELINNVVNS